MSVHGPAGEPISYLALQEGTAVRSAEGEPIGTVAHVLADPDKDIFDGIVINADWLPSGHAFADATQVGEIRSGAVTLTVDAEAARMLPQPSENPAAMSASPDDAVDGGVAEKLRRAWDLISGNY